MKSVVKTLVSAPDELSRRGLLQLLANSRYKATILKGGLDALLSGAQDERKDEHELLVLMPGSQKSDHVSVSTIHALAQHCTVVIVADTCDGEFCHAAICAGAVAYVSRTISAQTLIEALDLVLEGKIVFPSELVDVVLGCGRDKAPANLPSSSRPISTDAPPDLSVREIEIIQRLVQGASNKCISRDLDIAETTVKVHVKTILRKIRAANRTQAAIWGLTHLPIPPPLLGPTQVAGGSAIAAAISKHSASFGIPTRQSDGPVAARQNAGGRVSRPIR